MILNSPEMKKLLKFKGGELTSTVVPDGQIKSLVIMDKAFVSRGKKAKRLYIDATFKIRPKLINKLTKILKNADLELETFGGIGPVHIKY